MKSTVPKILVVRFSSIGDIVLTTPVVRCLKQQLGAEVYYLTKERFRPVLEANPYIDGLFTFRKDLREVLPALKAARVDYLVDLHRNIRTLQLKLGLRIPFSSFPKFNIGKWLLVRFKSDQMARVHIVDRYMATVKRLGVRYDGNGLDFFLTPGSRVNPVQWMGVESPFAAVVIGAAHSTKRMPAEQIAEICERLTLPAFLLGGLSDKAEAEEIASRSGGKVIDVCGELSLGQSASLISQASVVISHDTGMMHIAAAHRRPIVSVWGNTVPAFGMTPFYPDGMDLNVTMEVEGLSCRPCSKIGFGQCPEGHFKCMKEQDTGRIAGEAIRMAEETEP